MPRSLNYYGQVDEFGRIHLDDRESINKDAMMFAGCRVVLSLRLAEKSMTNPQRRFYLGVIIPRVVDALIDLGHERWEATPKLVHELLWSRLGQFDPIEIEEIDDLSSSLFSAYIGSIQRFCAMHMDIYLPDPH